MCRAGAGGQPVQSLNVCKPSPLQLHLIRQAAISRRVAAPNLIVQPQELEAEVAQRQREVLRPPPGSDAAALPAHQRQRRLRVARGVLSERTARLAHEAACASGGGVLL